jgi:hypothetical protein
MTAKEKAEELFDRFINVKRPMLKGYNLSVNMHPEYVKQCALICVDEIISALENHKWQNILVIDLYKEVKEEIHKL